jgi:hypothetical protein
LISWDDKFADLAVALLAACLIAAAGFLWSLISRKNKGTVKIQYGIRPLYLLPGAVKQGYDIADFEKFTCIFYFPQKHLNVEIKLYLGRELRDGDAFATARFKPANVLMTHDIIYRNSGLFYDLNINDMPAKSGASIDVMRKKSVDPIIPKVYIDKNLIDFEEIEFDELFKIMNSGKKD